MCYPNIILMLFKIHHANTKGKKAFIQQQVWLFYSNFFLNQDMLWIILIDSGTSGKCSKQGCDVRDRKKQNTF